MAEEHCEKNVALDLIEKSTAVKWDRPIEKRREYYPVFSKSRFTPSALKYCKENGVLAFGSSAIERMLGIEGKTMINSS